MSDSIEFIAQLGVRLDQWTQGFQTAIQDVQSFAQGIQAAMEPLAQIVTAATTIIEADAQRIANSVRAATEVDPQLTEARAKMEEFHQILVNATKLQKVNIEFDEGSLEGIDRFSEQIRQHLGEVASEAKVEFQQLAHEIVDVLQATQGEASSPQRWKEIAAAVELIVQHEKERFQLEQDIFHVHQLALAAQQEETALAAAEVANRLAAEQARLSGQAKDLIKRGGDFVAPEELAQLKEVDSILRSKNQLDEASLVIIREALAALSQTVTENQKLLAVENQRLTINRQLAEQQNTLTDRLQQAQRLGKGLFSTSDLAIINDLNAQLKGGVTLRQEQLNLANNLVGAVENLVAAEKAGARAAIQDRIDKWKEEYGLVITVAQAIKLAEEEGKGFGTNFTAVMDVLSQRTRGFTLRLREIGQAATQVGREMQIFGVIATTSVLGAVQSAATTIERFRELREETGLNYVQVQQLAGAFREYGVGASAAERGIKQLAVALGEAHAGNDTAIDKFGKLGITWKDLNAVGFDLTKVSELVSDRLKGLTNDADRLDAGSALLGRNYAALAPAFLAGSAGLKQAMSDTLTISDEAAQKLSVVSQSFETLKFNIELVVAEFVTSAGPSIKAFEDTVTGLITSFRGLDASTKNVIATAALFLGPLVAIGGTLFVLVGTVANAIKGIIAISTVFQGAGIAANSATTAMGANSAAAQAVAAAHAEVAAAAAEMTAFFAPATVAIQANTTALAIGTEADYAYITAMEAMGADATMLAAQMGILTEAEAAAATTAAALAASVTTAAGGVGAAGVAAGAATPAVAELTVATTALDAAMSALSGPMGIVLATLGVVIGVAQSAAQKLEELRLAQGGFTTDSEKAVKTILKYNESLHGSIEGMRSNKELMFDSQTVIAALNTSIKNLRDQGQPFNSETIQSLIKMRDNLTAAATAFDLMGGSATKTDESLKNLTKDLNANVESLKTQIKQGKTVTAEQIEDARAAAEARIRELGRSDAETNNLIAQQNAKYQTLEDERTAAAVKGIKQRLQAGKEAFDQDLRQGHVHGLAEIQAFKDRQTAIINEETSSHALRLHLRNQLNLQVLAAITKLENQELAQEKQNVAKILEIRLAAINEETAAKNALLEGKHNDLAVASSKESLALQQQVADGKISEDQADRVRFDLAQKNRADEIAFLTSKSKIEHDSAVNAAKANQEALNGLTRQRDEQAQTLAFFKSKAGTDPKVIAEQEAALTALDAKISTTKKQLNDSTIAGERAVSDATIKINHLTEEGIIASLERRKKAHAELDSTEKALAQEEKKYFDDGVSKAEAAAAEEAVAFNQLVEKRLKALEDGHREGLISEQQYQDAVVRLYEDAGKEQTLIAKGIREASLSEFGKLFETLNKEGLVNQETVEKYLKEVEQSLQQFVAEQGSGVAATNGEFQKQLGIYEQLKKKLDELTGAAKKGKEGFSEFFKSFDLGSVNALDKTGKATAVSLQDKINSGTAAGGHDEFLQTLLGGSRGGSSTPRLDNLLRDGLGLQPAVTKVTGAMSQVEVSLNQLASTINGASAKIAGADHGGAVTDPLAKARRLDLQNQVDLKAPKAITFDASGRARTVNGQPVQHSESHTTNQFIIDGSQGDWNAAIGREYTRRARARMTKDVQDAGGLVGDIMGGH